MTQTHIYFQIASVRLARISVSLVVSFCGPLSGPFVVLASNENHSGRINEKASDVAVLARQNKRVSYQSQLRIVL